MIFNDRDLLEKGTRAFVASVRAYKEHRCEYVFQYESLDLAEYADAFNLLRVPKMKELREGKINGFVEEKQHIVEKIAFADKAREKQRQIKLLQILKEKEEITKARKLLRKAKPMNENEKLKKKLDNVSKYGGKGVKRKKKPSKGNKYWNEKNMVRRETKKGTMGVCSNHF
jgi:ATP-dependent RNA helicase DDX55/SPB4|tara:strand:+ start:112 stop:624 length:513 start_codon:yes stop_codon:yes gene_type:complete